MKKMTNNTLFVTGTDTSVGKTYVCARLLDFLKTSGISAGYQKWVATGVETDPPEDLASCLAAANIPLDPGLLEKLTPYRFKLPASPHLAAEMENRRIDPEIIIANYKSLAAGYDWLIVEGVGGVLVPLRRDLLLADLLAQLRPPTLIVARSGLGTLNHTLLTIEALRQRNIPVSGIVFSDSTTDEDEILVQDNMKTIREIGSVRIFGRLRRQQSAEEAEREFRSIGQAILKWLMKIENNKKMHF